VISYALQRLNLATTEGLTLLDIGSGSGNSIIPLLNLCPDSLVIASDLSVELLMLLKEVLAEQGRANNCALLQLNAEEIDFHPGSFDFVFGSAILHHLFYPEKTFAACKHVLKPGGHAVFFEPFETGHMALRNIYGAILDDPRRSTLSPETDQFLRAIMFDFDTRKGRDKSAPQFQQMDDKWLFTANYFQEICEKNRFSDCRIYPFGVSEALFAEKTETFLYQAMGKGRDALPEWAWEKIRRNDESYSHDAKEELLLNCIIIATN
jgi:ubiquinone/menaquinone biosynthesis C-methylase UbiE